MQLPSHMLQRGIHNMFHSSLMRIHHPNNDRRFPGQLYTQIVSETKLEHETEWAADKILSHLGSKTDAIFEVLWWARDKTWLLYNQVRDLQLLTPYLDAQGIKKILDLGASTRTPPTNDPQIFLGALTVSETYKNYWLRTETLCVPASHIAESHSPLSHLFFTIPDSPITMSFHSKNHYIPHPSLTSHPNSFVQLTTVEPNLIIHPT